MRFRHVLLAISIGLSIAPHEGGAQQVVAPPDTARPERSQPRVRFIVSGGLSVPTGGFSEYHDLGPQVAVSAVIRIFGQKLRLRPEAVYSRLEVVEQKVRALIGSQVVPSASLQQGSAGGGLPPKLPDLARLRDRSISSLLGTFANIELPLGNRGLQPYLIGGVGAVTFRTDVTTVGQAIDGIQWALNAGAGVRVRLGRIAGGLEARFREIPVDGARTFFENATTIPVSFSLVF